MPRSELVCLSTDPLTFDSVDTVFRDYDDFALLMRRGDLYELEGTGLFLIRHLAAHPHSGEELARLLSGHYAIPYDMAVRDVMEFVEDMALRGLATTSRRAPSRSSSHLDAALPTEVKCWQVAREQHIPLKCKFDVTYRCNIACKFCYNGPRPGLPGPYSLRDELTLEEIDDLFGQLREAGTFLLSLSGGEPFARHDLQNILSAAERYDFAIEILTNGTLITPEVASALRQHRIQLIVIPLFGAEPLTHDTFVRMPGAFAKACAGIEAVAAQGLEVGVRCAITQNNYSEWPKLRTLVESWGARCFPHVQVHLSSDRRVDTRNIRLTDTQLAEVFDSDVALNPGYRCEVGLARVDVLPNGDVALCSLLTEPLGNVRRQTFADTWHRSPKLEAVRQRMQSRAVACHGCHSDDEYRCSADALFDDGDLARPSSEALRVIRLAKDSGPESLTAVLGRS